MARKNVFRVRLSDGEWERLKAYAESREHTPPEVIRDYIKRLPKVEDSTSKHSEEKEEVVP